MKFNSLKSKVVLGIIVLLILAGAGTGIYKFNKNQGYNDLVKTANRYMDEGKYDDAIAAFQQSLNYKDDENVRRSIKVAESLKQEKVIYDDGIKLMNEKKYLEAIEKFNKVTKEDEKMYKDAQDKISECKRDYATLNIKNADKALKENRLDDANKYLQEVFKVDSESKEGQTLKAQVEKKKQEGIKNQQEPQKGITVEGAIKIVKNKFESTASNMVYQYDHDSTHDGRSFYVIHVFENMGDHTATKGWYGVDKENGKIYDEIFSEYIN